MAGNAGGGSAFGTIDDAARPLPVKLSTQARREALLPGALHNDFARRNNFDGLRFLAACAVVFSHAFLIAEGSEANEPLVALTGGQTILGLLAVFVFFAMSGFLVTQSYQSGPAASFALKRGLRIFPGLWVNLAVVGLVAGPLVTTLPLPDYFSSGQLAAFFRRNLLLQLPDTPLPGVLFSGNRTGLVVNGSLWTLRYELMMYVMVLLLGTLGLLRLSVSLVLVVVGIVAVLFETSLDALGDLGEWAWLVGFFASGMAMYFLRDSRWITWRIAGLAAIGLAVSAWCHLLIPLFPVFGGYLALFLALKYTPLLGFPRWTGDLSYGIYIYGWPSAQIVLWASGGSIAWWALFGLSLALSIALAWLSWHGIEKRALGLKHLLSPRGASSDYVMAPSSAPRGLAAHIFARFAPHAQRIPGSGACRRPARHGRG